MCLRFAENKAVWIDIGVSYWQLLPQTRSSGCGRLFSQLFHCTLVIQCAKGFPVTPKQALFYYTVQFFYVGELLPVVNYRWSFLTFLLCQGLLEGIRISFSSCSVCCLGCLWECWDRSLSDRHVPSYCLHRCFMLNRLIWCGSVLCALPVSCLCCS